MALQLLSDQPLGEGTPSDADGLDFRSYAEVLGRAALDTPGPLTIGVFGEWGSGKTSLMRLMQQFIDEAEPATDEEADTVTVWFNAWKFEGEDHPLIPLVATIVNAFENNKAVSRKLGDKVYELIAALRAVACGFAMRSTLNVPGANVQATWTGDGLGGQDGTKHFDAILKKSIYFTTFEHLDAAARAASVKIVVIIDDLDRCFPERAVHLLESIKLVLSQPGFIFVLGVARKVLEGYLKHKYEKEFGIKGFNGGAYMDKIVQLAFTIPPARGKMTRFWSSVVTRLSTEHRAEFMELGPIISTACGNNPRVAVRFVNSLLVDTAVYEATLADGASKKSLPLFAVSRSLQLRWPMVFSVLSESEEACNEVLTWLNGALPREDDAISASLKHIIDASREDATLKSLLSSEPGLMWLRQRDQRVATIEFLRIQQTAVLSRVAVVCCEADVGVARVIQRAFGSKGVATVVVSIQEQMRGAILGSELVVCIVSDPGSEVIGGWIEVARKNDKPVYLIQLPEREIPHALAHYEMALPMDEEGNSVARAIMDQHLSEEMQESAVEQVV